ncbi:MAG TPA: type II toxin-antitoxin system PemK/MazF family toxin [Acidimicrobiales bacterium]|nr:type II toxin-antitoxin system PemK/MazF family toxin [Acidimicrobiales bacterium]HRA35607.1 type II toxin-antitoxin system PemK/MazF family toxin [Acidimicrobiales bacterium]
MGRRVNRGEVWLAEVGRKRRPVLVLTRSEVLDVRSLVTVAEVSTSARGLAAEVELDHVRVGLDRPSVVNCDGLHTVAQTTLTSRVGEVDEDTLVRVCSAVSYALGC